jgi:hypothetical protein
VRDSRTQNADAKTVQIKLDELIRLTTDILFAVAPKVAAKPPALRVSHLQQSRALAA